MDYNNCVLENGHETDQPSRKNPRLAGYDYRLSGGYFLTICTYDKQCLFGRIDNDRMILNRAGIIVRDEWLKSAQIRQEITLDDYVVMPNHIHGIVFISRHPNISSRSIAKPSGYAAKSLSSFVVGFKSAATRRINELKGTKGTKVWQRNYYEHIIRNEEDHSRIKHYIRENPVKWSSDSLFVDERN